MEAPWIRPSAATAEGSAWDACLTCVGREWDGSGTRVSAGRTERTADARTRTLPVVVLTSSNEEKDMVERVVYFAATVPGLDGDRAAVGGCLRSRIF